jgi:hypothetical protein
MMRNLHFIPTYLKSPLRKERVVKRQPRKRPLKRRKQPRRKSEEF